MRAFAAHTHTHNNRALPMRVGSTGETDAAARHTGQARPGGTRRQAMAAVHTATARARRQ